MQAQGGAKNPIIVLPDAEMESTTQIVVDSVYGCAGQRCLAASSILTIGEHKEFTERIVGMAHDRVTGYGLDPSSQMGSVITAESKERIEGLIEKGVNEGAKLVLDGRNAQISGYAQGNFLKPTILEDVPLKGELAQTEIFGPVMSLIHLDTVEEALDYLNQNPYGNMACIFTSNGGQPASFVTTPMRETLGLTLGWQLLWQNFPFQDGKTVSLAIYTVRESTP